MLDRIVGEPAAGVATGPVDAFAGPVGRRARAHVLGQGVPGRRPVGFVDGLLHLRQIRPAQIEHREELRIAQPRAGPGGERRRTRGEYQRKNEEPKFKLHTIELHPEY